MNNNLLDKKWTIDKLEWALLPAERPRLAGCNARLGVHGKNPLVRVARITIGGIVGFGSCRVNRERGQALIGTPVNELFMENGLISPAFRDIEYPLLDWLGKVNSKPVFRMFSRPGLDIPEGNIKVPCYDSTLYFDDLHIADHQAAVDWMKRDAQTGMDDGHRNFKIKVGRGARWMEQKAGLRRDIDIIRGVREIAGPEGRIMIDANNGYNLNMTKEVLLATADCSLYWIEEVFHEDLVLFEDLRNWMQDNKLDVKIADGEGQADPRLMEWAKAKVVDVVQYDIIHPGFNAWLEMGPQLDSWGAGSAPHSYGNVLGNYINGHLSTAIKGFQFVECDPAVVEGLDASTYPIQNGHVEIPDTPGFGLHLDNTYFTKKSQENGWVCSN